MPEIIALVPIPRNQGIQVPGALPAAKWVDAVSLTANVAKDYILAQDANDNVGTIIGITATAGPLWVQRNTPAVIPTGDILTGLSPALLRTADGFSYIIVVDRTDVLSFICASNCIVIIEAYR